MAEKEKILDLFGTDQPAQEDALNLNAYINGLTQFIKTCPTPMTISLQGSWGSGKSSMMNLLERGLTDSAVCVFFNTWQYSQFDLGEQLPLLFYQSLIEKLGTPQTPDTQPQPGKESDERNQRLAKALKQGLGHLAWVAAKRAGVDDVATAAVAAAKDIRTAWTGASPEPEKKAPTSLTDAVEGLRASFQELVNARCKQEEKERVVCFIDDLDRLPPARAVELMEVIKTAVECEHCVFILAIDYEVVLRGVRDKYGADFGAEKGRSFFDKMIQLPFDLPVEQYHLEQFLKSLIRNVGDKHCIVGLLGYRNAELHEVTEDTPAPDYPQNWAFVQDMALLAAGHNPRSLKRLFNAFTLNVQVVQSFKPNAIRGREWSLLFGVNALKFSSPRLYDYLISICQSHTRLGEFYRLFHTGQDVGDLTRRLGEGEIARATPLVRRLFTCPLLENEPFSTIYEGDLDGAETIQERWMLVRDGLPFPVRGWEALVKVLELGSVSNWNGKEYLMPEDRFAVLAALMRTITQRWQGERWNGLTPQRMEACVLELCDSLREDEQSFRAFWDQKEGEIIEGYGFGVSDYSPVGVYEALCAPEFLVFPRDFRVLVEKIRLGGPETEANMDQLAALLEKIYGVGKSPEPFDTPAARRRALTCLEPGS